MKVYPSPRTPPPCAEKCWEWVNSMAWIHIASTTACGHYFDTEAGIWRWHAPKTAEAKGDAA